jgi:hypothetical protein
MKIFSKKNPYSTEIKKILKKISILSNIHNLINKLIGFKMKFLIKTLLVIHYKRKILIWKKKQNHVLKALKIILRKNLKQNPLKNKIFIVKY